MQLFIDVFAQIFRTLWAHKLRSFLTMFGIAWGIGSLLLLVGLGEGFRSGSKRSLAEIGENIMMIFPGRAPAVLGSTSSARYYHLTYKDYLDIRNQCPHVRAIAPILQTNDVHAVSEFATASGQLTGTEPQYSGIRYLPLLQGRWINQLDDKQMRNVVVLGDEMTRHLFPGRPAIGAFILLNGYRFEVIGTLMRVGRGDENSTNMRAYIPYQVMRLDFPLKGENDDYDSLSFLNYQPTSAADHILARDEVRRVVARNHDFNYRDPDAFDEWDTVEQVQNMGLIFTAMDEFLGTVGFVTLALGAIGVVNIMLVAVTERTREIGLRKALGATGRSILFQFFAEGLLITLVSGLIGMGLAAGLMLAFRNYQGPGGFDPPRIVPTTAILAIGSLTIAGVFAGLYPARKAAKLEPVEALRQE
jgi:putative ABC transport system permease protein